MQKLLATVVTLTIVAVSAAPQGFINTLPLPVHTHFNPIHTHPLEPLRYIPVLKRTEVRDDAGQFALSYQTGDGQAYTEQGALKRNLENNDFVLVKQGSYSYTAPDGTPIFVSYTADENGFRPVGKHLPTPPVDFKPPTL